jgi:hypothetical protein
MGMLKMELDDARAIRRQRRLAFMRMFGAAPVPVPPRRARRMAVTTPTHVRGSIGCI